MAKSFSKRKGLLSQMLARKGPGPGHEGQTTSSLARWKRHESTVLGSTGSFINIGFGGRERCNLFGKNFCWLQMRGTGKDEVGRCTVREDEMSATSDGLRTVRACAGSGVSGGRCRNWLEAPIPTQECAQPRVRWPTAISPEVRLSFSPNAL